MQADVARRAELARALQRQRRELQEKEFGRLVEAGCNPYEVYRRRDQAAEVRKPYELSRGFVGTFIRTTAATRWHGFVVCGVRGRAVHCAPAWRRHDHAATHLVSLSYNRIIINH